MSSSQKLISQEKYYPEPRARLRADDEFREIQQTLHQDRIVVIPNLFNEPTLEQIRREVKTFNQTWWRYAFHPGPETKTAHVEFKYNDMKIFDHIDRVERANREGRFAYRFKRTENNHTKWCYCFSCRLRKTILSQEMKDLFSRITGEKVTTINESFASLYEEGDFLNTHHDKNKGDYTFIIGLTDNWKPEFGGVTNFYDSSKKAVYREISPQLNSLIIFKLKPLDHTDNHLDTPFGRMGQMDHFVTRVTIPGQRIAYTGWFNVEK